MNDPSLAECIREIVRDEIHDPVLLAVAERTGGLSLWVEMPGWHLVLLPTGEGVSFNPEDGSTEPVDERDQRLLHIKAAERYAQLSFLRPARGPHSIECPACRGTGELDVQAAFGDILTPEECARLPLDVFHEGRCWNCLGLGWVYCKSSGMGGRALSPWLIVLAVLAFSVVGFLSQGLPSPWALPVTLASLWVIFGIGEYMARRRRP